MRTVSIILIIVFCVIIYMYTLMMISYETAHKMQIKTIDSLHFQIDSLKNENFINSSNVGKYEIALEYLKEVNPNAAKQFEDFLYHQTE